MTDCTESIILILKNVQRRKKNPKQRFAKLRFKSDCVIYLIETLVFLLSWRCLLCHKHDSSEILWSYFHLGSLEGVMITLPVFPVHSISIRGVTATKIQAIEI